MAKQGKIRKEEVLRIVRDAFLEDKNVVPFSNWIFLDGLQYCSKCYRMYPNCEGHCNTNR